MLALVTCADAVGLDTDLPLLVQHIGEVEVAVWDDPSIDWTRFDAVVIRSAWDYPTRRDEFVGWARSVAATTTVWNPPDVVEWNTDKRYLADLAARGFPTVPSWFVEPGSPIPDDLDVAGDLVVKPTVGAGSIGVLRTHGDRALVGEHIAALHRAGQVAMVQPYRATIDVEGETGLVYLAGSFSHAFEKSAILSAPVEMEGTLYVKETVRPRVPSAAERSLADRLVESLPTTAYARVDLVPGESGPEILELELTEPSLFLDIDPLAPQRAADAFRRLAR